ncbi:choice-of-anchor V domain-containing protein [Flexibacter flexilis]|nr:choice-of-anchor V domain-containing protein [Flexibacter flexilis]
MIIFKKLQLKKNAKIVAVLGSAVALASAGILSNNGRAGYTGAPNESNCRSCHGSFALNATGGSVTLTSEPAMTNNQYVAGTSYTMTVTVARTGSSVFGLGVEVLNASNTNAGTLAVSNSTETQLKTSGTRSNIIHKLNGGLVSNSKAFSFKWTAPASGAATFYVATVAGNNNGSDNGDYVYTTSLALTAAPATSIKTLDKESLKLAIYPTPAQSQLSVNYELQESAHVKAKLVSLQGAAVAMLLDEKQNAGAQKMNFEIPATVAAGTYLLHLSIDDKSVVQKVVIQ